MWVLGIWTLVFCGQELYPLTGPPWSSQTLLFLNIDSGFAQSLIQALECDVILSVVHLFMPISHYLSPLTFPQFGNHCYFFHIACCFLFHCLYISPECHYNILSYVFRLIYICSLKSSSRFHEWFSLQSCLPTGLMTWVKSPRVMWWEEKTHSWKVSFAFPMCPTPPSTMKTNEYIDVN